MGYAPHEFKGFGLPVSHRVSLAEEGLEVLQRCFTGERFSFEGRRYHFRDVVITPGYVQPGGPPLWIAAMSAAGARRAAKFGAHLLPQGQRAESLDAWHTALTAQGRNPADHRIGIIRGVLVTDDVDKDWPAVRHAERYRMQLYQRFFEESGEGFGDGERIPQTWIVGNAGQCADAIVEFIDEFGVTDMVTWGARPASTPMRCSRASTA
ncbi:MAG: LLM class flavin-dependent oxidoreductase [Gammaproteobacteria bacterium]|nr:LLM class flavin-dependent oxidoreductase [Gammaproteobacteria bacterium]